MGRLYDRVYYTLYRMLISFGQTGSTDIPRPNVAILLSLFIGLNILAVVSLLSVTTGKFIIINSKVYTVIVMAAIIGLNFFLIFYRKRYKHVEASLSSTWSQEKNKNIILTTLYIIATAIFVWLSLRYIKNNPISE